MQSAACKIRTLTTKSSQLKRIHSYHAKLVDVFTKSTPALSSTKHDGMRRSSKIDRASVQECRARIRASLRRYSRPPDRAKNTTSMLAISTPLLTAGPEFLEHESWWLLTRESNWAGSPVINSSLPQGPLRLEPMKFHKIVFSKGRQRPSYEKSRFLRLTSKRNSRLRQTKTPTSTPETVGLFATPKACVLWA